MASRRVHQGGEHCVHGRQQFCRRGVGILDVEHVGHFGVEIDAGRVGERRARLRRQRTLIVRGVGGLLVLRLQPARPSCRRSPRGCPTSPGPRLGRTPGRLSGRSSSAEFDRCSSPIPSYCRYRRDCRDRRCRRRASRSMLPPWLGSTFGLTSISAARPVTSVSAGTPVAPGKVNRPGSGGWVGFARLVRLGEGADQAPGDLIELGLILRRDCIAQLRIAGERAGLDRHRRRRSRYRDAVDGDGVAARRPRAAWASA